ncbi:hypothetical protein GUITHDRAFT_99024 [Guillardia theta CCMP2712]|uniref:Uncharacterized protein n=1 Tax=Guillardia theta (strain CCMP2712) TaxID=905079 RepID=L1K3U4_GUITC|nr:hypothetical protein GUITHDRAFT_99024 [Guillardia theta CCMP2712]EKX55242.1 hypothetical protein GUITHDRAFT_99024 [Guillardia theta CCMP2712]|eukprot:XP_005842222.1 hypothetical protein GUITHDRAFT_99024 [Guillardia theta CCMP2712]
MVRERRRWMVGMAGGMAMGATMTFFVMLSLFHERLWPSTRPRRLATLSNVRVSLATIPSWMLFRASRSAVLQAEKELGKEFDVVSVQDSIKPLSISCSGEDKVSEEICELSMELSLAHLHGLWSSLSEVLPFAQTRRPSFNEADSCNVTSMSSSSHHGVHHVNVKCSNMGRRRRVGAFLSFINRHTKEEEEIPVLVSWLDHLSLPLFVAPFDLFLVAPFELSSLVEKQVSRLLRRRDDNAHKALCVRIRKWKDVGGGRVLCSTPGLEQGSVSSNVPIIWISKVAGDESSQTSTGKVDQVIRTLKAVEGSIGHVHNYEYFMFVEQSFFVCGRVFSHFLQNILSLRRSFTLIACGRELSCFLGEWRDLKFWSRAVSAPARERTSKSYSLLQVVGKEKIEFRRHFGDAPSFRSLEDMLFSADDEKGRQRCERTVRFSDEELHKPEAEETHEEETHCVGHIDMLAPCQDPHKTVSFLAHPRWSHQMRSKRRLLSVQILANDRPKQLLRTVMQLLTQLEPRCITIHLDHSKQDKIEPQQKLTTKVAHWLGSTFGTKWRRNGRKFLPAVTHRLGFQRNFASKNFTADLTPTDRLVHATWNALAYAFDDDPAGGACSPNATVILEDDLLPTHDAIEYFLMGKEIMDEDEEVLVVSAWNDNGFSLREGLRCATLRGEYFMSLGWLTTRRVFDRITSLPHLWPSVSVEHDGEQVVGSAIDGGWELPFLKLFKETGVGIFPAVSRVWHQSSRKGWSVNSLIQKQVLNAHTRLSSNASCTSDWTREKRYDQLIASTVSNGQWVNLSLYPCYKSLLAQAAPSSFVLATDLKFNSPPVVTLFHIFGLVKGFGRARGYYKGVIRFFFAQHNLLLLNSRSPFFRQAPARLRKLMLNERELSSFLDGTCAWHRQASHPLAVVNLPSSPSATTIVTLAAKRQSCSSACSQLNRTCKDWAALLAYSPSFLWSRGKLAPLNRSSSLLRGRPGVGYGSYLAFGREDLPILSKGEVLDGLPRLFRCRAVSGEEERICPCLERQYAAMAGAFGVLGTLDR